MGKTVYTDTAYRSFVEQVTAALDGKEDHLVALGAAENAVQLAGSGIAIGTMTQKLQAGQPDVTVRLLGKGGTVRMIQSGAIATGSRVVQDNAASGKVKLIPVAAGTYRSIGIKLTNAAGAAEDVIEVLDLVETVTVP